MGASVKIDGARAEVALHQGASLDIVVRRLKSCVAAFCLLLGVYGGMNENFVLVAGRSRWQADGV
jgi:hypothetical protein